MYLSNEQRVVLSPTDLADFLACRHKTTLELEAARGDRRRPNHPDPFTDLLRKRGEEHERRYVDSLRAQGLTVEDLSALRGSGDRAEKAARTLEAMRRGPNVIVQAPLFDGTWFGYADILLKVPGESALGDWHYEAQDTKLARETRAGAILQLCVYTDLLTAMQGREPERFVVVTPAGSHAYRVTDVAAHSRLVKANLKTHVGRGFSPAVYGAAKAAPHENTGSVHGAAKAAPHEDIGSASGAAEAAPHEDIGPIVPDPVEHCALCRWWDTCNAQRRAADHLQFVANLGRRHKKELEAHGITTKAALAAWEVPPKFKPSHGARETYVRLQEQAALQVKQADTDSPVYTLLPVEPHVAPDGTPLGLRGLKRLPEPSPGDLYLDLEGDPFARSAFAAEAGEGAREYLFGLGRIDPDGQFHFRGWWAFDDASERQAFEEVMDEIAKAIEAHPGAHVYHYAAYEQTAFKRLAGRYATRAEQLDELLRGGCLVDLYAIVRESVRAGVESYSIKELEPFYAFARDIDLRKAGQERQAIEIALESGAIDAITPEIRDAVEGYNRDDVRSTWELHKWLEARRDEAIARGDDVPRPVAKEGEAPEELGERQQRVEDLRARLLSLAAPDRPSSPLVLAAYLLDWHRRESKAEWWEYFRLVGLSDDDLLDERKAVSGLRFVESKPFISEKTGKPTKSTIDRYTFPPQDCDVREGQKLNLTDAKQWGEVVAIDRQRGLLDVKVGPSRAGQRPTAAFAHEVVGAQKIEDALYQIGCDLADGTATPLALALLNAALPSVRDVRQLRDGVLAIQGPPGTGKTYSGGVMICDLVSAGKSVGVTALSHAAIANLLKAVRKEATRRGIEVPIRHVRPEEDENAFTDDNPQVVGGTAWHWCHPDTPAIDVLFVDEAGQMSLANTLACTVAANALVLLGDPQQLEQPTKGVHPDGVGGSALQHYLAGHRTMPAERGEFLDTTRRLAPSICAFTSEAFYEGRLKPLDGLERQVLTGSSRFSGAGLRVEPVPHDGNRNASDEEVAEVLRIVDDLLAPGSQWVDEHGVAKQSTPHDILIVAPYNAQVTRIEEALAQNVGQGFSPAGDAAVGRGFSPADVAVGTVDRFQGQEAPVVIYSMATSRPEDAPRGLGFLYSLNRFNVATSRARCMCIVVASPALFAPDCQSPAQMVLANALCRYVELASREQGIIEA